MEMNVHTRLLRAFVTVSETGNVTRAAKRLARTQPALSMQLKRLEDEVGAQLLTRSPRGVVLTEAGELLLSYAQKALTLGEDVRRQIAERQLVSHVRLGILEDLAVTRLPSIIWRFRLRHPTVKIEPTSASSVELAAGFNMGRFDIVMADSACFDRCPNERVSRQLVLCCTRRFKVDGDLAIPLVLFEGTCSWQDRFLEQLSIERAAWRVACRVSTFASLLLAVRAKIGIAPMLPEAVPPDCEAQQLIEGLPPPPVAEFGIYVADPALALMAELGDCIREGFDH